MELDPARGTCVFPRLARAVHAQKSRHLPLRRVSQAAAGSIICPASGRRAGTASATGWMLSRHGAHLHHLLMAHAKRQPWQANRPRTGMGFFFYECMNTHLDFGPY